MMLVQGTRSRFQGSYVALPTPFRKGEVDYASLEHLIEWHIEGGTDGLVLAGTTGEAATLTDGERIGLFQCAVGVARGKLPVVAGIGTNCTRTTVELAQQAAAAGVDALLAVTPYYNKPSRRGLVLHFSALAECTDKPIILYNVPSRTGVDLPVEAVRELGDAHANIVAIKEAKPDLDKVRALVQNPKVAVLCGEDSMIADFMSLGAVGVIGVVNNLVPRKVVELVRAALPGGDSVLAARLVEELAPLCRDLFLESNPVPVKTALALMHKLREEVRLPLAPMEFETRVKLEATLRACRLI
jgi:4-hydroxy-tetrahydrodipicolinate synthase